jgi:hypothetical protein
MESFGFRLGEIAAAASIWRDPAPTPESIACEGVTFWCANVGNDRLSALLRFAAAAAHENDHAEQDGDNAANYA